MNSASLIQAQGRPEFAKGGCVADVLPAEAMDPGELEPGFRRSDQERAHNLDFSVAPRREADRAGTLPLIGGLEIERKNSWHRIIRLYASVPAGAGMNQLCPIGFSDLARVNNLDTITAGRSPGQNL